VSVILEGVAARLLGPAVMVAAALVVKGYTDVGDGFSAGVIVSVAIALRYVTLGPEKAERGLPLLRRAPLGMAVGMLIVLAVGFFSVLDGGPPLTHHPAPGEEVVKIGTLELITAVAFDLGLLLVVVGALVTILRHLSRLVAEADA
jgi:multisubunit Na+/H+ antiporter MnhB subunit